MTWTAEITAAGERLDAMGSMARKALRAFSIEYECRLPNYAPVTVEIDERSADFEITGVYVSGTSHDIRDDLSADALMCLYGQVHEKIAAELIDERENSRELAADLRRDAEGGP